MGRLSLLDKEKYVKYCKDTNTAKCLKCDRELKGLISGNIKRHYIQMHKYKFVAPVPREKKKRVVRKVQLQQTKEEFIKLCIGMVAVNNMPLHLFDDKQYFKKIIQPFEEAYNTNLNSTNIMPYIHDAANQIKDVLKESMQNRMLSIKVDVLPVGKMGKTVLCVNVQHIDNFKIVLNTIGMVIVKRQVTDNVIQEEVLKCLNEFEVEQGQIYSLTTDNGANKLTVPEDILHDFEVLYLMHFQSTADEEEAMDDDVKPFDCLGSLVPAVKCASDAAQYCLNTIQIQLEQCRQLVRNLTTETIFTNDHNITMPPLDNVTSWYSTFRMMESLLTLHAFKFHISDGIDWNFIETFVSAFTPMVECIDKLQTEQYIIGDFYRDWLACEIQLKKKCNNIYAMQLVEAMQKQKEELLKNVAFLAALYLDPRFNFLNSPYLTDEQRQMALVHILMTNSTINYLNGMAGNDDEVSNNYEVKHIVDVPPADPYNDLEKDFEQATSSTSAMSFSTDCKYTSSYTSPNHEKPDLPAVAPDDPYKDLEEEFQQAKKPTVVINTNTTTRQKLEKLIYSQRMPFSTNVLEYWKDNESLDWELRSLVQVILALPTSQASLEKTFSALTTIINAPKSKFNADEAKNVLLIKLNHNLLEAVDL